MYHVNNKLFAVIWFVSTFYMFQIKFIINYYGYYV